MTILDIEKASQPDTTIGSRLGKVFARLGSVSLIRRVIAVVLAAAGFAALVAYQALRVLEVNVASAVLGVFADQSLYARVKGLPGIGYALGKDWWALPIGADLSGVSVLAGVLLIGAVLVVVPRFSPMSAALAVSISLLVVLVSFQARIVALAFVWTESDSTTYHAAVLKSGVVVYAAVGVVVALVIYLFSRRRS